MKPKAQLKGTFIAIAGALTLAACSDSGTTTTLDAEPTVTIGLPRVLLDSSALDSQNLFPTIRLSTGAYISLSRGSGENWTGTIEVDVGRSYTADVVWKENYNGEYLELAKLTQELEVANDGTIVRTNGDDYTTDIDTDGDGVTNLQERQNGTNPLVSDNPDSQSANDGIDSGSDNSANAGTDTGTGTDTGISTGTDSGTGNNAETASDDAVPADGSDTTSPDSSAAETGSNATGGSAGTGGTSDADNSTTDSAGVDETAVDAQETLPPVVADVVVPRISSTDAPLIDGKKVTTNSLGSLTGEWASAIQLDNSGAPLYIDNLMIDVDAEAPDGTPYRRWAAMHDGVYLYIVVLVDDDGDRHRDSGVSLAEDDSLEVFIDGDNSKSTQYDSNDFHRILPVQLAEGYKQSATSGDIAGPSSSQAALALDFATGPGEGPDGLRRTRFEQDVYELRINLASAGIDTNKPIGFELQVNDDDGGGGRDSKWGWKHPSGNGSDVDGTVSNPSLMGTLVLE